MTSAVSLHRRAAAGLLLAAAAACHRAEEEDLNPEPVREPVTLTVHNHGFYDVDIYALANSSGGPAIREGMCSGSGSRVLVIPPSDIQPGGILQIQVHAIGTNRTWTSRPVSVDPGGGAVLEIDMDANGYMGRSMLIPVSSGGGPDQGREPRGE